MLPDITRLDHDQRERVLRFAATFLWADLELADGERTFLRGLARDLRLDDADARASALCAGPPLPEDLDPNDLDRRTADVIRHVALAAIASDGKVRAEEMTMFELLDDLLPR